MTITPEKSPNDPRTYRYLELNNGLKVLLISDCDADKAAAALAVRCGYINDPIKRQGLAHFLEHMLFLGTDQFPEAEHYQRFIQQHGGHHNGWTGSDSSNYFFDIAPDFFEAALMRFSRFFIAPRLDQHWLDKERNAIEAEYRLKLHDESRRLDQVLKECANPDHPFTQFSVGNLVTLAGESDQLSAEISNFFTTHYQAPNMGLVLSAPLELDELATLAERYFAPIIGGTATKRKLPSLYRDSDLGIIMTLRPYKEQRKLRLSFPLPPQRQLYRRKPLTYLTNILNSDVRGGLNAWLKERDWGDAVHAGVGNQGDDSAELVINIALTPQGEEHWHDVVTEIFAYFDLIHAEGFSAWRYTERQRLLASAFAVQEVGKVIDRVSALAINLFHYDPEHLLNGDYLLEGCSEEELLTILNLLTPERLRIALITPKAECDREAKWYQTPYSVRPFSKEELHAWHHPRVTTALTLPPPNPYVPARLIARLLQKEAEFPERIYDHAGLKIWHLHDSEFRVPKGSLYLAIESTQLESHHAQASLQLLSELLSDQLEERLANARGAGIMARLSAHQTGLTLRLEGFNEHQPKLLARILPLLHETPLDEKRFNAIKRLVIRHAENSLQAKPITQLYQHLSALLQPNNPDWSELIEPLHAITFSELVDFRAQLFQAPALELMLCGDWLAEEALALQHLLEPLRQHTAQSLPQRKVVNLRGMGALYWTLPTPQREAALIHYLQAPDDSEESDALMLLASQVVSSPFFHELRTKQQLGYLVGTGIFSVQRGIGLIFYLQSPTATPQELHRAVQRFLSLLPLALLELSEEAWQSHKRALQQKLTERETSQRGRAGDFWNALSAGDETFCRHIRVANQIGGLRKEQLLRFINQFRTNSADSLTLYATSSLQDELFTPSGSLINDKTEWQQRCHYL